MPVVILCVCLAAATLASRSSFQYDTFQPYLVNKRHLLQARYLQCASDRRYFCQQNRPRIGRPFVTKFLQMAALQSADHGGITRAQNVPAAVLWNHVWCCNCSPAPAPPLLPPPHRQLRVRESTHSCLHTEASECWTRISLRSHAVADTCGLHCANATAPQCCRAYTPSRNYAMYGFQVLQQPLQRPQLPQARSAVGHLICE